MRKITLVLSLTISLASFSQNFSLPSLDYNYNELKIAIDSTTMSIHHSKHHQGYVTKLNKAIENSTDTSKTLEQLFLEISSKNDAIRNNAGGHYNHSLFWKILTPKKTTRSESLENAIKLSFGSYENFQSELNKAASTQFGSGWAWLIVTPDKKLAVCSTANQNNPLMIDEPVKGIPILGIDVWEHAYYLKYQNKRGDYLSAIWQIINWENVSKFYDDALNNTDLLNKLK